MFNAHSSIKHIPSGSAGSRFDGGGVPAQLWTGFGFSSLIALVALSPNTQALTDPEEALLAALWSAAVVTALWFTLSLLLVQFADWSGSRLLHQLSEQVAMPLARRLAQGSLALGLVALPACGSNTESRPEMVLVESGVAAPISVTTSTPQLEVTTSVAYHAPTSAVDSISSSVPSALTDSPAEEEVPSAPETLTQPASGTEAGPHIVSKGENLWSIAKAHLTKSDGEAPTNAEIGPYWAQLIEQNRDSLSSGNTNLIYPGESIRLPAIRVAPATAAAPATTD